MDFGGRVSEAVDAFRDSHADIALCTDARSQLVLCGNFLIYLFLLAPSPGQVQATFQLLERYHESLLRLREWADDDASIAFLRPAALRMDSFFTQAAQIMRTGSRSDSLSGAHTAMSS